MDGVKAVVQNIDVKLKSTSVRTDEIAEVALKNFKWNANVSEENIILRFIARKEVVFRNI